MASENEQGFASVLGNRDFVRLWVAQTIGLASQNGIHFVQMVLIEHLTGSTTQMGLMILAFSIPGVLFSAIAGVVVDRLPRKLVLDVSNILRILTTLGYVLVLRTLEGWQALLAIYLVTFIISSISQFFAPALWAEIPRLIGEDKLLVANNLFNLTYAVSQAAGLIVLAPLAVKLIGIEGTFIAIAVSYAISTILIALVPGEGRPKAKEEEERAPAFAAAWTDIQEGWRFVASQRGIYLPMTQLTLIAILIMVMAMIAPGFANRVLGMAPEDAVFIFAPAGVGMLLSTVVLGRFGQRLNREAWVNFSLLATAGGFGAMGFISQGRGMSYTGVGQSSGVSFGATAAIMGIALLVGFFMATGNTVAQTALQERSPAPIRGRVYAVQFLLANLVGIPPLLGLGGVADTLGIAVVFFVIAAATLAVWVISIIHSRRLHLAEDRAAHDAEVNADRLLGRRRILIIASKGDSGVRQAAEALARMLGRAVEIEPRITIVDGLDLLPAALARLGHFLRSTIRRGTALWRWLWQISAPPAATARLTSAIELISGTSIRHTLLSQRPDHIVVMQPLFGHLLAQANQKLGRSDPVVSVATDLVALHPLWLCPQTSLCVASQAAEESALRGGMPSDQVRLVGLPIDPEFDGRTCDRTALRCKLGWPTDRPTILLVSGTTDARQFFEVARSVALRHPRAHLAIVSGQNESLRERLERARWPIPTSIYGYVHQMPEFMHASDILVTRAGSTTIAEALAAGLPIVLIETEGQEEANVSYVVGAGVGASASEPGQIAAIVTEWLRPGNPTCQEMAQRALALATPEAGWEIAAHILESAPAWVEEKSDDEREELESEAMEQ